ncbi:unnamed protein product [Leptidea sinapis]|uniref:C-type lectin domain-containing protein n=1 Tax=Leptidea sinapis TaxID=189913 RepID=A0A5E4QPX8_9NEOP|nr:unnamed protein product [Leptidea sinapis]
MHARLLLVTLVYCALPLARASKTAKFRCDYTYFQDAGAFLKLHEIPANWREARLRCHLEGGALASPLDSHLLQAMQTLMAGGPKLKCGVFLGIHATFSRGDFFSIEGVPLNKIPHKWAEGEPDNYNDQESCLLLTPQGEFADVNCSDTYPYVCYKKTPVGMKTMCGTVDPGYTFEPKTGSCYKFHSTPRTWSRAFMTW